MAAGLDDPAHSVSFWRTTSGSEIDCVVYGPSGFWAVEVKHAGSVRPKDLRALKAFAADYPEARLRPLYRGRERLVVDGIMCMPCGEYLKAVTPGAGPRRSFRRAADQGSPFGEGSFDYILVTDLRDQPVDAFLDEESPGARTSRLLTPPH